MPANVRLAEEDIMTIAAPRQDRRFSWLARPMTAEQAAKLKRLAQAAYDLDAFKPNLTCAEADLRIAALIAKLKVLDGPPHTL
jgi:hypothetical protein